MQNLVPVIVVIVVNTYVMVILLRKVLKINTQKERTEKFKSKSKLILSFSIISINLGITWFLFVLYIQKWSSYFSYLSYVFIVLNGSQVSLILLFRKWRMNLIFFIFLNNREFLFSSIKWCYSINKKQESQWSICPKVHLKIEPVLQTIAKIFRTLKSCIDYK